MHQKPTTTRRHFLHGLGALIALPPLETFSHPIKLPDSSPNPTNSGLGVTPSGMPLRMGFIMFPNGANMPRWRAQGEGHDFTFGDSLAPLTPFRNKIQQFTGYTHINANSHGNGSGDHARATACFLTGAHPFKTAGANIRAGISIDQVAAQKIGHLTRLASLEFGTEKSRKTGSCDSGYACAYQYNISWASETLPMAPEPDPRQAFERLFGSGAGGERQKNMQERLNSRRSVLDLVLQDARSLKKELGLTDQRKMEEYLMSIRSLEQQIEKSERFTLPSTDMEKPPSAPTKHSEHIRMMADLMALAFQSDSTRIATLMLSNEGSNRSFQEIDIPEGHHGLSHHQNKPEALEKVARIDHFYAEQLAYFLQRLSDLKDVDGSSVLDNSMILYGCGNGDGNKHDHMDLPILLAGGGGKRLNTGRHVHFTEKRPLTNLFLGMMGNMGIPLGKFGDSTAVETNL
jgi:Protein of unknown function (DUF1552)